MKSFIKQQKGYTLLIVLLIITIIGILTPPLVNSVLTSAAQFKLSEQTLQKDKLVDMGKKFAETSIIKQLNQLNQLTEEMEENLDEELKYKLRSYELPINFEGTQYDGVVEIDYEIELDIGTNDTLEITYTILGSLMNKDPDRTVIGESVSSTETILIQRSGNENNSQWRVVGSS